MRINIRVSSDPKFSGSIDQAFVLNVDADETIISVKNQICKQRSTLSPSNLKLLFSGKHLPDFIGTTTRPLRLDDFNVLEGCTLHVTRSPASLFDGQTVAKLPTDQSATKARQRWARKALEFDFDDDFHIVDPASHFHLLNQLETNVVRSSEYYRSKRHYSFEYDFDLNLNDHHSVDKLGVPSE